MALMGPTNQQKNKILEEINETNPNKLEENKAIIKQWLNSQPHLPKNYGELFSHLFFINKKPVWHKKSIEGVSLLRAFEKKFICHTSLDESSSLIHDDKDIDSHLNTLLHMCAYTAFESSVLIKQFDRAMED